MAETLDKLQLVRNKRISLREKLASRKKHRRIDVLEQSSDIKSADGGLFDLTELAELDESAVEISVVQLLKNDSAVGMNSSSLSGQLCEQFDRRVDEQCVRKILDKLASQRLISVREVIVRDVCVAEVVSVDCVRLNLLYDSTGKTDASAGGKSPPFNQSSSGDSAAVGTSKNHSYELMDLLELPSAREKINERVRDEILFLLNKPTVTECLTAQMFRSQGGAQVHEYCKHGTREECSRVSGQVSCDKVHFKRIIQRHTDESLGDCSFLNTCFHMQTCKYVHYVVDSEDVECRKKVLESHASADTIPVVSKHDANSTSSRALVLQTPLQKRPILTPPQWIQCDLRVFDMSVIGECAVIMADPPWDIHMELPYGTLSDHEMRSLNIPSLQTCGLFFLWVTGRAMELGRECLQLWGYERVDELIWVKTNQLQRIIRTGRTGHWLNHGKEHCLVGMKGDLGGSLNRGLDADVIVAEVRATSHKPDEIYGIIERLSPGTRKLELFGRSHNAQPNWITLGNQLDGVNLSDPDIIQRFKERYPTGSAFTTT